MPENLRKTFARLFPRDFGRVIEFAGQVQGEVIPCSVETLLELDEVYSEVHAAMNTVEGPVLRCTFLLLGDPASISSLAPMPITDVADWLRELANLTAGRIQNSLYGYDIACRLGLPVTVQHKEWLGMCGDWTAMSVPTVLGKVFACVDLDCDPSWETSSDEIDASMPEDAVIF